LLLSWGLIFRARSSWIRCTDALNKALKLTWFDGHGIIALLVLSCCFHQTGLDLLFAHYLICSHSNLPIICSPWLYCLLLCYKILVWLASLALHPIPRSCAKRRDHFTLLGNTSLLPLQCTSSTPYLCF
jgi:hypothetical protein